eukprot:jgi/Mesvir1/16417/Mv18149-RA.2
MAISRLGVVLLGFCCLGIRALLAMTNLGDALSRRVEVVTPLTSISRVSEGAQLLELGLSPYEGSLCHSPPLLVVLLSPFLRASGAASSRWVATLMRLAPFMLADACAALLLYRIAVAYLGSRRGRWRRLGGPPGGQESHAVQQPQQLQPQTTSSSPPSEAVTASPCPMLPPATHVPLLFLANPLAIAACVGGSTASIDNAAILLALFGGMYGNASLAACGLALASYLSLYPVMLAVPVLLLLVHGPDTGPAGASGPSQELAPTEGRADGAGGSLARCGAPASSRPWLPATLLLATYTALWSAALLLLSAMALRGRGGMRAMMHGTYGFMLRVEDLRPNLGLHWYFFTEMFDHFRALFTFVFAAMAPCYLLPLAFRLSSRPLFLAFSYLVLTAILKPYPSVADGALYLGLLPIFHQQLSRGLRLTFVTINGYLYALALGPLLYNLWIFQGSGNANFFYATTLVYAMAQSLLLMDAIRCTLDHDKQRKVEAARVTSSAEGSKAT